MQETYKGWNITADEEKEIFRASNGENTISDKSLKALKKKIDKFGFERTPVIRIDYGNHPVFGSITSVANDNHNYPEVWFVADDGERSKISIGCIYKTTEENKTIANEMLKLSEERNALDQKMRDLRDSMKDGIMNADIGLEERK